MCNSIFLDHVSDYMLTRHYARLTIRSYIYWTKFYINFHNKQHPSKLNEIHVQRFLSYLTLHRHVASSTQTQALNALVFLYKEIIKQPLALDMKFSKSIKQRKLPTVLTQNEIRSLFNNISPRYSLLAKLMYASGLRLMEAIRLRVQDIDFDHLTLSIWNAKGGKNRRVILARELIVELKEQILNAKKYYHLDNQNQAYAGVKLPFALSKKYTNTSYDFLWHFLFPSYKLSLEDTILMRRLFKKH